MSRVPPNVKAFCSFSRDGKDKYLLTNLTTKDQFSLVYEKGKLTISPIYLVNSVREISDTKHILIRENDL